MQHFSDEDRKMYSIRLSRQSRGGAWFFAGMAALFVLFGILGASGVIKLADDMNFGFLISVVVLVLFFCGTLSAVFFSYRRKVDQILSRGYRSVVAQIVHISPPSETGFTIKFEYQDGSGETKTGGQAYIGKVDAEIGDSVELCVVHDNVQFFAPELDTCISFGKFQTPIR